MSHPSSSPPVADAAPPVQQEVIDLPAAASKQGNQNPVSLLGSSIDGPLPVLRRVVVNPYLRRQPTSTGDKRAVGALSTSQQSLIDPYCISQSQQNHPTLGESSSAMGLHSRHRVGAVKTSKRFGAGKKKIATKKANNRKNHLGGVELGIEHAFNPNHHCVVCRATYLGCAKPHRPHHERCHRNKMTKGHIPSAKMVPTGMIEERTVKVNHSVVPVRNSANGKQGTTAWEKLEAVWGRARMASLPSVNQKSPSTVSKEQSGPNKAIAGMEESLGHHLRCVLEAKMASIENPSSKLHERSAKIVNQCNKSLPVAIALLFDYINDQTRISYRSKTGKEPSGDETTFTIGFAETLSERHKYFAPNTCIFTFPKDPSSHPFQHYHSIEGMSIFSLDWEAMFPGMQLPRCMEIGCGGILVHDRSNFSKNKKLFPVFTTGGIVMWGSFMTYKCLQCQTSFNGNDGCFLAKLDDDIADAYPVEPRYALANYRFHLSTDLTEDLRSTMLSNGSGDSFCAKLHHYQGHRFSHLVKTYASKAKRSHLGGGVPSHWTIRFSEWNGKFAPSGSQLRSYYLDGENSPLTTYQFSQYDRYKRELQQVGRNMSVLSAAVDWTFQVLKTYVSLPGSKAWKVCSKWQSATLILLGW